MELKTTENDWILEENNSSILISFHSIQTKLEMKSKIMANVEIANVDNLILYVSTLNTILGSWGSNSGSTRRSNWPMCFCKQYFNTILIAEILKKLESHLKIDLQNFTSVLFHFLPAQTYNRKPNRKSIGIKVSYGLNLRLLIEYENVLTLSMVTRLASWEKLSKSQN